jgi:hypothetical protein
VVVAGDAANAVLSMWSNDRIGRMYWRNDFMVFSSENDPLVSDETRGESVYLLVVSVV